ncbi:MAG TPA: carboxypeptidase regulatory-like domain-containing protein [Bacteroidia bacterium]|nr:carboxypeptidase regulatory-like domain-containing protein [Bacteroidia bacterium]
MKNLRQTVITILLLIASINVFSQGSMGTLKGQILNDDNLPVFGATIKILQGGVLIGGTGTDENGMYTYKPLNAGSYDVLISSVETQSKKVTDVRVSSEKTTYLDVTVSANKFEEVEIVAYVKPVIDKTFMDIKEISAEDFLHMAVDRGNIIDAVVNISSEATQDANGDLHIRGGRGDATAFIVDGMKSPTINGVPALSVENVSIITGGIPAQYGDVTSGVIVVTTKDYFGGIQSKRMRDNYIMANKERIKREKEALQKEKQRKKEIEEELRLEEESKSKGL